MLRLPYFLANWLTDDSEVISFICLPSFAARKIPGALICLTDSNGLFFVVIFSLKLFACKSSSLLTHEALNLFIWRCATEHSSSCL
jgi:hypothetical protein